MTTALVATLLAITPKDDNRVSPGVLGFIVVAILGLATWLLIRSMGRQLKKIDLPDQGVPTHPEAVDPAAEHTGTPHSADPGSAGEAEERRPGQ